MYTGVVNIYKEAGFTSHDVVAKLRGILRQKKIGHTGTLDPDAVGVLPVCIGRATKLAETLSGGDKTYEAVLLLGRETDTQDASGTCTAEWPVTCSEEDVREVLQTFVGEQEQIPPMWSAKKVGGRRLYALARAGQTVEREAVPVRIAEVTVLACDLPRVTFRVTCSKGTYIRTLCSDIGSRLGCGGCMESLVRTRAGQFLLEDAHTLDEVAGRVREGTFEEILQRPDAFFRELPELRTAPASDAPAHNGNGIPAKAADTAPRVRGYDSEGRFLGIYRYRRPQGLYVPELFFYEREDP